MAKRTSQIQRTIEFFQKVDLDTAVDLLTLLRGVVAERKKAEAPSEPPKRKRGRKKASQPGTNEKPKEKAKDSAPKPTEFPEFPVRGVRGDETFGEGA